MRYTSVYTFYNDIKAHLEKYGEPSLIVYNRDDASLYGFMDSASGKHWIISKHEMKISLKEASSPDEIKIKEMISTLSQEQVCSSLNDLLKKD